MSISIIGSNITENSKDQELLKKLKKIPSLNGYADKEGNIYKVKRGIITQIHETSYKDKRKNCYVFDNGHATLNEIMHETYPELDKTFGKVIPNTHNKLSMKSDGSIWTIGFKPERFDDKRNPDSKGRISIHGIRLHPAQVYKKLYRNIGFDSLEDLETFLNENDVITDNNNGEQFYAIVGKVRNSHAFVVIKDAKEKFTLTQYVDFLSSYANRVPISFNKNKQDFLKILNIINTLKNINTQIHTVLKDME